jgi:alkanesulfonate monooxygenase SsuD/methylene tetrahydromethanopterin reductase-like flavin-dependent oxidoreductase (luciferase family)
MDIDRDQGLLESASTIATVAEESGFDSLWLTDRVVGGATGAPGGTGATGGAGATADSGGSAEIDVGRDFNRKIEKTDGDRSRPGPDGGRSTFEAYSLLGALAVRTSSIRLGAWPIRLEARAPSVLAKIITAVDLVSKGRGTLTLACDSDDFGPNDVDRLEEQLLLCRAMLDDERPTYAGRFYTIDGAVNRPRPVQSGGVPIVVRIAGGAPVAAPIATEILRVAATHADAVTVAGGPDVVADARKSLRLSHQSGSGQESQFQPDHVGLIWEGAVATEESEEGEASLASGEHSASPNRLADQINELQRAGADGCILSLPRSDPLSFLRRASQVRPLRR